MRRVASVPDALRLAVLPGYVPAPATMQDAALTVDAARRRLSSPLNGCAEVLGVVKPIEPHKRRIILKPEEDVSAIRDVAIRLRI